MIPIWGTSTGLNPTLDLDFVGATSLDSRITFTRASTATFFDSTGTLQTAAINAARFDTNPSTLAPLGLLIEEQRTNLLLQSADFTTTWSQTNVTITANSTASPDGGTNGDTLLINVAGATTSQTSQSFAAGSTITVSVFAKKNASNFVRFEVGGVVNCWFDLNTGVTGTNSAGSGNVLFSAKSIQAISNGWYRCVLTVTTSTITTLGVNIFATNADNVSSSINSSVFLWGAQAEVGAFPTSYIPTTTTALTRNEDVASMTGTNFSSWYNASEGTFVATAIFNALTSSQYTVWRVDDTTDNERIFARNNGSALLQNVGIDGGATQWNLNANNTLTAQLQFKHAAAIKLNDIATAFNGANVLTDASATLPTVTRLLLGGALGGDYLNGYIQRIAYYPRRLPDSTLQALTA